MIKFVQLHYQITTYMGVLYVADISKEKECQRLHTSIVFSLAIMSLLIFQQLEYTVYHKTTKLIVIPSKISNLT